MYFRPLCFLFFSVAFNGTNCFETFDPSIQESVANASDELIAICGSDDLACLVDGVVGGPADASAYLTDLQEIEAIQNQLLGNDPNPNPTPGPVPSPVVTPSPVDTPSPVLKPTTNKGKKEQGMMGMGKKDDYYGKGDYWAAYYNKDKGKGKGKGMRMGKGKGMGMMGMGKRSPAIHKTTYTVRFSYEETFAFQLGGITSLTSFPLLYSTVGMFVLGSFR